MPPDTEVTLIEVEVPVDVDLIEVEMIPDLDVVEVEIPGEQGPAPTVPRYALVPVNSIAGVLTIPFNIGSTVLVDLTENVTSVVFSGAPANDEAQRLTVYFRQAGSGGYTVNGWPGILKWPSNVQPPVTPTLGAIDGFVFDTIDGGVTYIGARVGSNW